MPVMIQSSAAWLAPHAPARAERPTTAPKARALAHAFMAFLPLSAALAAIVGTQPIRSCGREPVVSTSRQEPAIFERLWCFRPYGARPWRVGSAPVSEAPASAAHKVQRGRKKSFKL